MDLAKRAQKALPGDTALQAKFKWPSKACISFSVHFFLHSASSRSPLNLSSLSNGSRDSPASESKRMPRSVISNREFIWDSSSSKLVHRVFRWRLFGSPTRRKRRALEMASCEGGISEWSGSLTVKGVSKRLAIAFPSSPHNRHPMRKPAAKSEQAEVGSHRNRSQDTKLGSSRVTPDLLSTFSMSLPYKE
ncbi:uncharacterized protein LOC143829384 isoform X1 [Paroedura picta]|uniref:uncharacterized protein LOC143829384 isoform X1 n=1 Tax=Paroedura picta TaxID=143630 RepID=UPI004056176F